MEPASFFHDVVQPSLARLEQWTGLKSDDRAHQMVMTIAGQETGWAARVQDGGPAHSYWQFELGGGVMGVYGRARSQLYKVCDALDIPFAPATIFGAMVWNDTLAACMARLLLWVDPAPLPELEQQDPAYAYYLRTWGPGLPRPATWPVRYATALSLVRG